MDDKKLQDSKGDSRDRFNLVVWFQGLFKNNRAPVGKERRRFRRYQEHNLIKYTIPGDGKELSFIRNISPRGLLFHSKVPLEAGSSIAVEMNFPKQGSVIKAKIIIVHVEPMKRSGGFSVGGEFIDLDDKTRNFLEKEYPSESS